MDSCGEQLHPNWRALATIHVPLKRFIPEGADAASKGTADKKGATYKIHVEGGGGREVRQFYDEITSKSTNDVAVQKRTRSEPPAVPAENRAATETFDAEKFFRATMTNNVRQLRRFNYQANDLNSRDHYGWTGLMMAACEGAEAAVKHLLQLGDSGVDSGARDRSGNTAADLARKKGHFKIVNLLETYRNSCAPADKLLGDEDLVVPPSPLVLEPFFCATCKRTFNESTLRQHQTSTVHQFNEKSVLPANKLQKFNISARDRGLQLMVKQGWDKESGLGPDQSGRLYPVKTVIRKQRTGLGIEQPAARITHFEAFDVRATQRHQNSNYYKKKPRTRNDMRSEKQREWKRERRLRNELS